MKNNHNSNIEFAILNRFLWKYLVILETKFIVQIKVIKFSCNKFINVDKLNCVIELQLIVDLWSIVIVRKSIYDLILDIDNT